MNRSGVVRPGSLLRFIIGLLLAIEVVRQLVFGHELSIIATVLALAFLVLSALFFIVRF